MIYTGSSINICKFNKNHPLWVCGNAMKIGNPCTYVKCSDCYKAPKKWTRRTSRASRKKSKKSKCSHTILDPFEDTKYYISPFDVVYANEDTWPKICVLCQEQIVVINGV